MDSNITYTVTLDSDKNPIVVARCMGLTARAAVEREGLVWTHWNDIDSLEHSFREAAAQARIWLIEQIRAIQIWSYKHTELPHD